MSPFQGVYRWASGEEGSLGESVLQPFQALFQVLNLVLLLGVSANRVHGFGRFN
jgi:hypothetical protein